LTDLRSATKHFYTRTRTTDSGAADEIAVRFREGPVVARLAFLGSDENTPDRVARSASALDGRVQALLRGELRAQGMDPGLAAHLPPPVDGVGPVLGRVSISPEAWAAIDTTGDPDTVQSTLRNGGATRLAFQRSALAADADHVMEFVLFPFARGEAARSFVGGYLDQITADPASRREVTGIGDAGAFAFHDDVYEAQFAVGRYVADVACLAPFATVGAVCEAPVREVAAAWYARLQSSSGDGSSTGGIGRDLTDPRAETFVRRVVPTLLADNADESDAGGVDTTMAGTWRVLSARLFYDAGGAGSARTEGPDLTLGSDGAYVYGSTTGTWSVGPVADDDWSRWQVSPYGPMRKITFAGWQPGGSADGPVEESTGPVDYFWAIYRAEPPTVGDPGQVQIKFGRRN